MSPEFAYFKYRAPEPGRNQPGSEIGNAQPVAPLKVMESLPQAMLRWARCTCR